MFFVLKVPSNVSMQENNIGHLLLDDKIFFRLRFLLGFV